MTTSLCSRHTKSTYFGGVFYASQKRGFMLHPIRSLVCNYCNTLYITKYHLYIIEYHGQWNQTLGIYHVDLYPINKKFPTFSGILLYL